MTYTTGDVCNECDQGCLWYQDDGYDQDQIPMLLETCDYCGRKKRYVDPDFDEWFSDSALNQEA